MSDVAATDRTADISPIPRPPMFWRVLRILIIVYCGVLAALLLFVVMESGVQQFFNIKGLVAVRDARSLLEWFILNTGNAATLVMAMSCLAWAVAWHRGEGRRAYRLELFYGSAAVLMFLGTVGLIASGGVFGYRNGHPHLMETLLTVSTIGVVANAPALMMATYVLWGVIRRSMPARLWGMT